MSINYKESPFQVSELGPRMLRFIGSDETTDRSGDIVDLNGWKLENYQKNPVVLWAHDSCRPPVGKTRAVRVNQREKRLEFDVYFPTMEEISTDKSNPSDHAKFVDTIYNLYKGGYLAAVSVGFKSLSASPTGEGYGLRFSGQELLELSLVPVPANANALAVIKSMGVETKPEKGDTMETVEKSGARLSKLSRERLTKLRDELSAFLVEPDDEEEEPKAAPNGGIEALPEGEGGIQHPKMIDLGTLSLDHIEALR
jgi:hypothetical protein